MAIAKREFDNELLDKLDAVRDRLVELTTDDGVGCQMVIEGLMVGFAMSVANQQKGDACYIIDGMAKHAKQYIAGPNLIVDGKHRKL